VLHKIKHDGFRIRALRDAAGVRIFSRNGQASPQRPNYFGLFSPPVRPDAGGLWGLIKGL